MKTESNPIAEFEKEKCKNIEAMAKSGPLKEMANAFITASAKYKYCYNFTWLGRPMIQYPEDIIALQEIIWEIKPELIIETGIAHGGSLIFHSSILELIGGNGEVLGIDVDIRSHNRTEIEKHSMFKRIKLIQGSSIDSDIVAQVQKIASNKKPILVILDSNHTHDHVAKELELYSPLVTKGSYLVVFDTVIEEMPDEHFSDRPWKKGNNPMTALKAFLKQNPRFEVNHRVTDKMLITAAPGSYLHCIENSP